MTTAKQTIDTIADAISETLRPPSLATSVVGMLRKLADRCNGMTLEPHDAHAGLWWLSQPHSGDEHNPMAIGMRALYGEMADAIECEGDDAELDRLAVVFEIAAIDIMPMPPEIAYLLNEHCNELLLLSGEISRT